MDLYNVIGRHVIQIERLIRNQIDPTDLSRDRTQDKVLN